MSIFRTRVSRIIGARGGTVIAGVQPIPMSGFRTWLGIMWCAGVLKPQDVARRHLSLGDRIDARHPAQQLCVLQPVEVVVQGGPADFTIRRQPSLGGKTPEIRVEAVAKVPENDLRCGFQPALFDGPEGGFVAHGATLRAGICTRLVKP